MKSKRAKDYIVEYQRYENGRFVLDIGDVNVVGLIVEEDMADKACRLFEQFMSGVFQGDTPKKMAQEFKQKLME